MVNACVFFLLIFDLGSREREAGSVIIVWGSELGGREHQIPTVFSTDRYFGGRRLRREIHNASFSIQFYFLKSFVNLPNILHSYVTRT